MAGLVVGTSGHIDHGKTTLVKALTGIDTDRLAEEKARGITIELGFAHLTLEGGARLAFVDVPGHERFVKTMIAGATGIDCVLWIVAADEGVMPQSREHLDILRLLGLKKGIIVLTKVDLVDLELKELATLDVREAVRGTFLETAPVIPFSAHTLEGKDALLNALKEIASTVDARAMGGAFRLPVDRVFTLKGFGTVVTGTVSSGRAMVGETLEVVPGGRSVKVRGMQVHGGEVRACVAGQRAAINLQGVDREELLRGQQLCTPGSLPVTSMIDVAYEHLETSGIVLTHRSRIRFHQGTVEVGGVAHVLGPELEPGQTGFLQLRLDEPVAVQAGDRYVLRRESPMETLGGGVVLDPRPAKHRGRARQEAAELFARQEPGAGESMILSWLELAGAGGIALDELWRRSGLERESVRALLREAREAGLAFALEPEGREYVGKRAFDAQLSAILSCLEVFHRQNPMKPGATRGEVRAGVPYSSDRVFLKALEGLLNDGRIELSGTVYRLAHFAPSVSGREAEVAARLRRHLLGAGLAVPFALELQALLQDGAESVEEVLQYLADVGELVKVREGYFVDADAIKSLQVQLETFFQTEEELRPPQFKELTGLSRKWAIPLLEYLDKVQLTRRVGEIRLWRARPRPGTPSS